MEYFDRWFSLRGNKAPEVPEAEDPRIKFRPEVLDRALALLGTSRQKLTELASQEQVARQASSTETRQQAIAAEEAAHKRYLEERDCIELALGKRLRVVEGLHKQARADEYEAALHGELARLVGKETN